MDRTNQRNDHLDLGELWLIARNNRLLIIAGAALVLIAVGAVTLTSRMTFRTRGSLYLGELQERGPSRPPVAGQWDVLGTDSGDVATEIEILRSQDLIRRAVLQSGLNVDVLPADTREPRYWRWRLSHRDAHVLDAGARQLAVSNATVAGSARVERFRLHFLAGAAYEVWRGGERIGTGLIGREFHGDGLSLNVDLGLDGTPPVGAIYTLAVSPPDVAVDEVARVLSVFVPKVTGPGDTVKVVTIDFVDTSPLRAARFVDTLMRVYLERRQSWKTEEATRAELFVAGQVLGMKEALDDAERKLAQYRQGSNVVVLSDEAKGMIEELGKYEEQRVAARLRVAAFSQVQELLQQDHAPIEQYLVGETDDPVLAGLSNNLATAQQDLRKIEERFTPDAPAAREQQAQVDGQLKMVKDYVLGRSMRAQRQLDSLGQMIAQFEKKLRTVPSAEFDLAQLTRNAEVLSKMYSFLLERQQQVAVTKASTISRNRVLDSALIPYREDSPALAIRLVAAALLGLLGGALVALLRRWLAPTFQTERELLRHLTGPSVDRSASVVALVPDARSGGRASVRHWSPARQASSAAMFEFAPESAFAEAFRHLRTNLYLASANQPAQVLLISSPSPGDGKTVCAQALAAALAADGKHVLLVDADMRRHSRDPEGRDQDWDVRPPRGLSDILAGRCHWSEAVQAWPAGATTDAAGSPNFGADQRALQDAKPFDAIAAGSPTASPAELLSGPSFAQLLDYLRRSYDFVVIDSPPFPLVVDALVVSVHADRVLTVLRVGNSDREAADAQLRRFAPLGGRHGVIVNGIAAPAAYGQHGYGAPYASEFEPLAQTDQLSAPA